VSFRITKKRVYMVLRASDKKIAGVMVTSGGPSPWEPPGYAAPIDQTESIPAEEIRERAQTLGAMLRRNTGLRKN
jgi:hypothetical protein